MSSDVKIQNRCDHIISWNRRRLNEDRKTIRLQYPVASKRSIRLRINDVEVPKDNYIVETSRNTLTDIASSAIVLNRKVKDYVPIVEAYYNTYIEYCPKCLGVKFLDDPIYNNQGDYTQVERERLLVQSVEKYIVTRIESNPFHQWLGTELHSLIGTKINDLDVIQTRVVEQVNNAIEQFKRIQQQLVASGREVTDGELFNQLLSVEIEQDQEDLTIIHVIVKFTARSGKTLTYTQLLELSQFRYRLAF